MVHGFLSDIILEKKPKKLYLIEKDDDLSKFLSEKYKNNNIIEIINTDILNYNLSKLNNLKKFLLISNLPYNISTKIF